MTGKLECPNGAGGRSGALLSAILLLCPAYAAAQEARSSTPATVYEPAGFAQYNPRTALDLVSLIPGFLIAEADDRRGLGAQEANVLIDGRAVRGKANDATDALKRINARDVLRIEIITASNESSGVGQQIANVVLAKKAAGPRGQFAWRPSTRLRDPDPAWFNGDASISGDEGALTYSLGVRNTSLRTGAAGSARVTDASGQLTEFRDEGYFERSDLPRIAADLRYAPHGGAVAGLRASYQRYYYDFEERSARSPTGLVPRSRSLTQTQSGERFEVAGDVEFSAGPGRLKIIGLHATGARPTDTRVSTIFGAGRHPEGTRFLTSGEERETVLRSEYRGSSGATNWAIGLERAVNILDNASSFSRLGADGEYEEVFFPGSSGRVREGRHDALLSVARQISPSFTVKGSIGGEVSTLSLRGDVQSRRTFQRAKGSLSVAWQPVSKVRATAKIERRVGQIAFFDFLASRNLLDDRASVGNAELVPPQSWSAESEVNWSFASLGSTTFRLYGQRIEDLVEQVPVEVIGEAPGNLKTAYLYGLDSKTTLLLDSFGWAGARLDARFQLQGSDVNDPVTGRPRRISNSLVRVIEVALRRDVPRTNWAWGVALDHRHRAPDFRIGELARYRNGPVSGTAYIENKDVAGLTVRASLGNLLSSGQDLDRFLFDGRRDAPLLTIERRRRSVGPTASLSISGNF